jgi:hypothetical protein
MKGFDINNDIIRPFDLVVKVDKSFDLDDDETIDIFSLSEKASLFKFEDGVDKKVFTDPVWILYNGDWNDTGIWDDEAIWIDGE